MTSTKLINLKYDLFVIRYGETYFSFRSLAFFFFFYMFLLPFPLNCARIASPVLQSLFNIYLFHGVCKPCNDFYVLGTPLMKGQARNVWKETPTTTRHFCSSI